jgi:hypothetical protein
MKIIRGEGHKVSPTFFECQELVDFVVANAAKSSGPGRSPPIDWRRPQHPIERIDPID